MIEEGTAGQAQSFLQQLTTPQPLYKAPLQYTETVKRYYANCNSREQRLQ